MELKKNYKFWFATGSQDLYGDECLSHVAKHAQIIVQNFNESGILPFEVVWKPTLIDSTSIRRTFEEANADEECAGVITWMHTFSPAKSWIGGFVQIVPVHAIVMILSCPLSLQVTITAGSG